MRLTIASVDYAPQALDEQAPFSMELLREIPGPDRPDYWLARLEKPLRWIRLDHEVEVNHIVLAARWAGTRIEPGVQHFPVGIAFVTDPSLLEDARFEFSKAEYVAIGIAEDTTDGRPHEPLKSILAGNIGRSFGKGSST